MEDGNKSHIFLLKEGFFWRCYNRSAMRFVTYIENYSVKIKAIKKLKQTVYYCGFPDSQLAPILLKVKRNGFTMKREGDGKIEIGGLPEDEFHFEAWKNTQKDVQAEITGRVEESQSRYVSVESQDNNAGIIRKIKDFQLSTVTPIQAMLFVQELKNEIQ